jgi:hypothetical protein
MKSVVIPDVHTHIDTAQYILDNVSADEYIFLGDYFDEFHDNASITKTTAEWLKETLNRDDTIMLWGNHDLPYRFSHNKRAMCPGFTHDKCRAANSVLNFNDWGKLRWYYKTQDNWYLSHGGLSPVYFLHPINGFSDEYLNENIEYAEKMFYANMDCCITDDWDGFLWYRWNIFEPIDGINQIVGHTPDHQVRAKFLLKNDKISNVVPSKITNIKSSNYCIDTAGDHYAIIEDGICFIEENPYKEIVEKQRASISTSRSVYEY